MARWLKDYLHFGSKRSPPQPPKPDYTESEILRAYRAQKSLDFEDPYEDKDNEKGLSGSQSRLDELQLTIVSPRHRLIKVEPTESKRKHHLGSDDESRGKVTGVCDYSNPFDSKSNEFDHEEMDDTSYMEPYNSQRPLTDQHNSGERETDKVLQLYDSPYNDKYRTIPHERCQPSDDERPADEYDQPWEWKKDNISRAFAVQFEGSGWPCGSPSSRARLLQSTPRSPVHLAPCSAEFTCSQREHGSPPKDLAEVSRVRKTNGELQRHGWFHGAMSCTDAERRLHKSEAGSFLVRTEAESMYFLSVRGHYSILHVKLIGMPDGHFMLGDSGPSFPSIPDLVHYYCQSPLLFPGEGQVCLQHVVPAVAQ